LILPRIERLDALCLSIPLGMGLLTWFLFLASWTGIPLVLWTVIVVYLGLLGLLLYARWRMGGLKIPVVRELHFPELPLIGSSLRASAIPILVAFVLFAILALLSVGRSYSMFDDMAIWSLKGYGIAYKGTIFAYGYLGGHGLAYPLNFSLAIAVFKLASGDVLPGSKFLYPIFIAALLLAGYRFLRRSGVRKSLAWSGMLFIITVPVIFEFSTFGFVNLPFACYLVLGALWGIDGFIHNDSRAFLLSGLLFAFGGWTRSEGILFATILILCLIAAEWLAGRRTWRSLWMLLPVGIVPGLWLIFASSYIQKDQAGRSLSALIQLWAASGLHGGPIRKIYLFGRQSLLNARIWGYTAPVIAILAALGLVRIIIAYLVDRQAIRQTRSVQALEGQRLSFRHLRTIVWPLLVTTILAVAVPIGLFYVESSNEANFYQFLVVSFDRAYFPAFLLVVFLLLVWFGAPLRGSPEDG
jgi:hypothetical protein